MSLVFETGYKLAVALTSLVAMLVALLKLAEVYKLVYNLISNSRKYNFFVYFKFKIRSGPVERSVS
jgi:hypothetical protein